MDRRSETLKRFAEKVVSKEILMKGVSGRKQTDRATKGQLKVLKEYYKFLKIERNLSLPSITSYLSTIRTFITKTKKEFKDITKGDIENYFLSKYVEDQSDYSKQRIRTVIKAFFQWFYKMKDDKYPEVVDWIKSLPNNNKRLLPKNLLTEKEILKLVNACDNPRDRALVFILYDSGCRVSEISNLDIKDVVLEDYRSLITVNGKTGMRKVPLVKSVSMIRDWLNNHPYKDNPEAPLFISLSNKNYGERILKDGIEQVLKRLKKRAKIKKRIYPHLFRHTRLTELVRKGVQESVLRNFAGWSPSSDMPEVYIHLSAKDVQNAILEIEGIKQKEIPTDKLLKPIKCPRCDEENSPTFKFCSKCATPLDQESREEIGYMMRWIGFIRKHKPEIRKIMKDNIEREEVKITLLEIP